MKRLSQILLSLFLTSPVLAAVSKSGSNELFEVVYTGPNEGRAIEPLELLVTNRKDGKKSVIKVGDKEAEATVDRILLNGPYLFVLLVEGFADRWCVGFQAFDLRSGKETKFDFTGKELWNSAASDDGSMVVFTESYGRHRELDQLDTIHLVSLGSDGPTDRVISDKFFVKSNFLFSYDKKSLLFAARTPHSKPSQGLSKLLCLVKTDLVNGAAPVISPIDKKGNLNPDEKTLNGFLNHCNQMGYGSIANEFSTLKLSWRASNMVELNCPGIQLETP